MTNGARQRWFAAAAAGAVLLALFQFAGNPVRGYIDTASLFYWWGWQWFNPGSEAEHGPLILGLSGWLLWRNLRAAGRGNLAPGSVWPAAAALAAGLALYALSFLAQQTRLGILGFLLCTWGVLRLGGGRRWGAAAAFPVAFLVFAIPVNVLDSLGFWLRVWVVDASAAIVRGAGIGVLQSGTQLVAADGGYNYDVAAACSGVRSLTAMVALSLLAGYLNFTTAWRRAAVLLLCFPLVYVGNVARIVAIVFAAEAGGPRWGDIAHEAMGYGIFGIVLGGVLGGIAVLRRVAPERVSEGSPSTPGETEPVRSAAAWAVAAGVAALAAGAASWARGLADAPWRGDAGVVLAADGAAPAELPAFIGTEWIGRRAEVSAVEREVLPRDTGFSRKLYVPLAAADKAVLLSIVLTGRDRSSIHTPELCLVGQGWTVRGTATHRFVYPGKTDAGFPATVLQVEREMATARGKTVVPQTVAYWFVGADTIEPVHWRRVVRDAWRRVVRGQADRWAYVLMQTDAADGDAAALARMQAVLDGTLPAFQRPMATDR